MNDDGDNLQRHALRLERLAGRTEKAEKVADLLQAKLEKTEDVRELKDLTAAWASAERVLRMHVMLEAKLEHEARPLVREQARLTRPDPLEEKRDVVRRHVNRFDWPERDRFEVLGQVDDLDPLDFELPLDALFRRLCDEAGVDMPETLLIPPPQAEEASAPPPPEASDPRAYEQSPIWRQQMAQIERERAEREANLRGRNDSS